MDELKPCPFCGGEASIRLFYKCRYGVYCDECSSRVGGLFEKEEEAAAEWNQRTECSPKVPHMWAFDYHGVSEPGPDDWPDSVTVGKTDIGAGGCESRRYIPEKTCHMEYIKRGPLFNVYRYTCCGYEHAEPRYVQGYTDLSGNYCPKCGAKVEQ